MAYCGRTARSRSASPRLLLQNAGGQRRGMGGAELMIEERDNSVAMRDGTRLAVDVYRPDAPGKYPVPYA